MWQNTDIFQAFEIVDTCNVVPFLLLKRLLTQGSKIVHIQALVCVLVSAPKIVCALVCAPKLICGLVCAPKLVGPLVFARVCAPKFLSALVCAPPKMCAQI